MRRAALVKIAYHQLRTDRQVLLAVEHAVAEPLWLRVQMVQETVQVVRALRRAAQYWYA